MSRTKRDCSQATASDCTPLHPFASGEKRVAFFIGKKAISYLIEATSTHLAESLFCVGMCLYICLRVPSVSSVIPD